MKDKKNDGEDLNKKVNSYMENMQRANPYIAFLPTGDGRHYIHEFMPDEEDNLIDISKYKKYQLNGLF